MALSYFYQIGINLKILITSPSMENVSGITEVVRNIFSYGTNTYEHFVVGSKDGTKKRFKWILTQLCLPFQFIHKLLFSSIDLVHINTALNPLSLCRDILLGIACRIVGKTCIIHFHGGKFFSFPTSIFFHFVLKVYTFCFHHFIVLSELEKRCLIEKFGFTESTIFILPNCVDCKILEKHELNKNNSVLQIVFMGRIEKEKGIYELLTALEELKKQQIGFKFILCGTGTHQKNVIEYANKMYTKCFEYRGIVTGEQKWETFASSDVFVLPSYYEGLPVALLESMMMGCIPIVTNVGSILEIVSDQANGFVVPLYKSEMIAKYVKDLSEDQILRHTMQQKAQDTILSQYCYDDYINSLEKIYQQLIGINQDVIDAKT